LPGVIKNKMPGFSQKTFGLRPKQHKILYYRSKALLPGRGSATLYEEGVRSYWEIENPLHWVKDVTLKEGTSKIKMGNAPQNISTIKNRCINIFRKK
jgi:predicted transposase YbfD/YdcC